MAIEVVLEGKLEEDKDWEGFCRLLKEACTKWLLKMEEFETYALIDVCPEGFIECSYKDTYLSITAQTNVAGAGFHAYVIDFFEYIQEISPIPLELQDPSGYPKTHNFKILQEQVFERWLGDIANYIKEMSKESKNLCISWPLDYYHPKEKADFVVTPMGYIAMEDFEMGTAKELAKRFFVWNEKGRDANYYRNCALNLLWKECYYEYSNMNEQTEKIANTILDYIELAYELDVTIPLPLAEYHMLATCLGRVEKIQSGVSQYIADLGYRRVFVEHDFGNWSILAHGCSEISFDESNQTLYMMAPYADASHPWEYMIKANGFSFKQPLLSFLSEIQEAKNAIKEFDIHDDHIMGKGFVEKLEDHYVIKVQLNATTEMLFLEVVVCNESLIDTLIEYIKQCKCRHKVDDTIKN